MCELGLQGTGPGSEGGIRGRVCCAKSRELALDYGRTLRPVAIKALFDRAAPMSAGCGAEDRLFAYCVVFVSLFFFVCF